MALHLIILLVAGLPAGAGTAVAQDGAVPVASAPARETPSDNAAIAAAAQTFRTRLEAMNAEARAAALAAGSNRRRSATSVEAVLARYTPGFETFAVMLEAHFAARAAAAPDDEARATIVQTGTATVARVRGVADQVRTGLAQQTSAGRAPEQPRNTQPSTGY